MGCTEDGRGRVDAVVWTGGVETPYRRAGDGPSVLLLLSRPLAADDPAAFTVLATRFRVIAPRLPPEADGADREAWLRGVVDGLGLDRPVVVTEAGLAGWLARCAALDPGRIRGVVAVDPSDGALLDAVMTAFEDD